MTTHLVVMTTHLVQLMGSCLGLNECYVIDVQMATSIMATWFMMVDGISLGIPVVLALGHQNGIKLIGVLRRLLGFTELRWSDGNSLSATNGIVLRSLDRQYYGCPNGNSNYGNMIHDGRWQPNWYTSRSGAWIFRWYWAQRNAQTITWEHQARLIWWHLTQCNWWDHA